MALLVATYCISAMNKANAARLNALADIDIAMYHSVYLSPADVNGFPNSTTTPLEKNLEIRRLLAQPPRKGFGSRDQVGC